MITLRPFIKDDIPQLITILNDKDVVRYLSSKIPYPYTEKDANWWINEGSQSGFIRAIVKDGLMVGCIGVNQGDFEYSRSGEIGYWLSKDHWRQGITREAILQITEYVFSDTNIVRIFASVFSQNQASMNLLDSTGFIREGILRKAIYKNGEYFDNHVYSLIKQSVE